MTYLKDISYYAQDKIDVTKLKVEDYITTDNMIPCRGGISIAENLPKANRVTKYVQGDVLVSNIRPYFKKIWLADKVGGCSNDVIVFRTNSELNNPKFLYYVLSQDSFFDYMMSGANGTKMPRGNKKTIPDFVVPTFDVDKQNKVAEILSTYDSLIENNKKQISLLEEAAQRLYKDWFVYMHFPGYETVEIVDEIPAGWKIKKISNFGLVVTGKTPSTLKKQYYGEDVPFVKIPDMHNNIYSISTETSLSKEGAKTQKNKFIPKNSIMVSCIGTVGLVNIAVKECQTNQQINSIILNDEQDLYYLFFYLKDLKNLLDGVGSSGATMTNVNKEKFSGLDVLYPSNKIIFEFNDIVEPIFKKIYSLSTMNKKLNEIRDLLLPKIMSGEIEVL